MCTSSRTVGWSCSQSAHGLEHQGFGVTTARDAEQAWEDLKDECPHDVLITDVILPGDNGTTPRNEAA